MPGLATDTPRPLYGQKTPPKKTGGFLCEFLNRTLDTKFHVSTTVRAKGWSLFLKHGKKPECLVNRTTAGLLGTDKPKQI